MEQQIKDELNLDLTVSTVDQSFLIQPRIVVGQHLVRKLVRKSYIFYILELRTGVEAETMKNILSQILESCEEILEKGLGGISFIINGAHHPVKNLNIASIKQLLTSIMSVSKEDDYFFTIQKTRHAIQTVSKKLQEAKVTLLFFFSYVKIDHSLGVKKRSYIDHLNQHSQECLQEVQRLSKAIRSYTEQCKCYIISLDKQGEEEQDYSLADTDLMNQINLLVGNYGSMLYRNYSNNQLRESFKEITSLMLNQLYSLSIMLPTIDKLKKATKYYLFCNDLKQFKPERDIFVLRNNFDLEEVRQHNILIADAKLIEQKVGEINARPNIILKQLDFTELIIARTQLYNEQLSQISWKLSLEIVTYRRRYESGKSFIVMNINEYLLLNLRERVFRIDQIGKQIYASIFQSKTKNKHKLMEHYNQLKRKVDAIQEVLLNVFKKRIGGTQIGKLSQLINLGTIKRALKNKLIRRINANPYLLDQVYRNIEQIVDNSTINFIDLQTNSQQIRSSLGNCVLSDFNFVKSMQAYDAIGIAFEIQRPQSAIADPGRIKVRQVSPFVMRTSQFFEKFIYKINYTPQLVNITLGACLTCQKYNCYKIKHQILTPRKIESTEVIKYKTQVVKAEQVSWNKDIGTNSFDQKLSPNQRIVSDLSYQTRESDYLRDKGELHKYNYSQRGDYTDRVGRIPTVLGFIPLYLTKQHWLIAKQLMKPCLGWTATGQPLGYLFAQYQIIPFLVLSNLIRTCKQKQYELQQEHKKVDACSNQKELNELESKVNMMKERLTRFRTLMRTVQQTCKYILIELSAQKYQNKLLDNIFKQYHDYKQPINRTVDIIPNNGAFISQLFCAFNNQLLPKPKQAQFHQFFVRLVQEQLRRETDGWNQQQVQDRYVDKLLNVEVSGIKNWKFNIVGGEQYLQKFNTALQGYDVQRNAVQLQREELDMIIKKGGQFNDSQRLTIIEYKHLYENKALWMWYVRFLLYGQMQRIKIHKWKCLDLNNSYMLFTLIIQNKRQRKNYKRRQAILSGEYVDPFDYPQAFRFLFYEFVKLRAKKEGELLKTYNTKVCIKAAQIFSQTGRLEEAAGTLIGLHSNSLVSFYNELARGKSVIVDEKLKMLMNGTYRGVYLFQGWKMSRRRWWKLWKVYPFQFEIFRYKF